MSDFDAARKKSRRHELPFRALEACQAEVERLKAKVLVLEDLDRHANRDIESQRKRAEKAEAELAAERESTALLARKLVERTKERDAGRERAEKLEKALRHFHERQILEERGEALRPAAPKCSDGVEGCGCLFDEHGHIAPDPMPSEKPKP